LVNLPHIERHTYYRRSKKNIEVADNALIKQLLLILAAAPNFLEAIANVSFSY